MTKKVKAAAGYDHVTPQLIARVTAVILDAEKHKYSVSRVYRAYNEAFQKRDVPQTCSSCLRNRVRELRKWLAGYKPAPETPVRGKDESAYDFLVRRSGLAIDGGPESELATLKTVVETSGQGIPGGMTNEEGAAVMARIEELEAEPQYDDPGFVVPAPGVTRIPIRDGAVPIDFTPGKEDPNKGTVVYADGGKVKPGTYTTATGDALAVQPGGKATIKEDSLL